MFDTLKRPFSSPPVFGDSADERNAEEASESSGAARRGTVTCNMLLRWLYEWEWFVCLLERLVGGGNGGYIEGCVQ